MALPFRSPFLRTKDGPIVYRLGRQVFILVRGVRFPLGLLGTKGLRICSGVLWFYDILGESNGQERGLSRR